MRTMLDRMYHISPREEQFAYREWRRHRQRAAAELRKLGWAVFCDEEEDDVQ